MGCFFCVWANVHSIMIRNIDFAIGFLAQKDFDFVWVKEWQCFLVKGLGDHFHRILDTDELEGMVLRFVASTVESKQFQMAFVRDIIEQSQILVEKKVFSVSARYIAFTDTLFDMETFEPVPFSDKIITTYGVPFAFAGIENSPSERWKYYLESTFVLEDSLTHDPTLIPVLQEMMGNVLSHSMHAHAAFFLTGEGQNGKSKLLGVIQAMVGDQFCHNLSIETLTTSKFSTSELVGKRLNCCSEEESKYLRTDKFKALVSGDSVAAERKYGASFIFKPSAKFIFATNDPPAFDGINFGVKRRMKIIPFYRRFTDADKIPEMEAQLLQELPAILWWSIKGAKKLKEQNYVFSTSASEAIMREMENFEMDSSSVARFLREQWVVDPECSGITSRDLYDLYKIFCTDDTFKPRNRNNFLKDLRKVYPKAKSFIKWDGANSVRAYPLILKSVLKTNTEEINF